MDFNSSFLRPVATMALKELIESLTGKKKLKEDSTSEMNKLKEEIERLTKEKESKNALLLAARDTELKVTSQRNQYLQQEVAKLRKKLSQEQKAGEKSSELLKKNMEKISTLENEMEDIKTLKEEKEDEINDIKTGYEKQKEDIKELNDLVRLLAKKTGKNESADNPSTSKSLSESDILTKFISLFEKCNLDNLEETETKKKRSRKAKKNSSDLKPNVQEPDSDMKRGDLVNPMGPQQPMNVAYFHPGGQHSPMSYMGGPLQYPMNMSAPPNMVGPYNQNTQQYGPPMHMGPLSPGNFRPPPPPPLMNFPPPPQALHSPSAPSLTALHSPSFPMHHHNQRPKQPFLQPNADKKLSNFHKKDNFKPTPNSKPSKATEQKTEEKDELGKNNNKSLNKSGPCTDLWSQLEELKSKMQGKEANRQHLCTQVSTMMAEASKSSITSKDHFMTELSECLETINKIPDKDGAGPSRGSGRVYHRGGRGKFPGGGNYYRKNSAGNDRSGNNLSQSKEDSDENNCSDDDVSSLRSEPVNDNGRRDWYKHRDNYRGGWRGNWRGQRGNWDGHRGGRGSYNRNRPTNTVSSEQTNVEFGIEADEFRFSSSKPFQENKSHYGANEGRDENEYSDDASSLCSEPAYNRDRRGGFKPRGNWRGNRGRGGRGNYRGKNLRGAVSTEAISVGATTAAEENQNAARPSQPGRNKYQNRSNRKNDDQEGNLIQFDDTEEESSSKAAAFASPAIMQQFLGHTIPSLTEAIMNKIDVTLKVKNIVMVTTENGNVIRESPDTLLDIIQFKRNYPSTCVISNE